MQRQQQQFLKRLAFLYFWNVTRLRNWLTLEEKFGSEKFLFENRDVDRRRDDWEEKKTEMFSEHDN